MWYFSWFLRSYTSSFFCWTKIRNSIAWAMTIILLRENFKIMKNKSKYLHKFSTIVVVNFPFRIYIYRTWFWNIQFAFRKNETQTHWLMMLLMSRCSWPAHNHYTQMKCEFFFPWFMFCCCKNETENCNEMKTWNVCEKNKSIQQINEHKNKTVGKKSIDIYHIISSGLDRMEQWHFNDSIYSTRIL